MSLLDPDDRTVYLSALRPPDGYTVDHAIGTTYSVDLPTLLSVPLAFSLFDQGESQSELLKDRVLLVEALRRYAGQTTLFCQMGQIAFPRAPSMLFTALEPMIMQVKPRVPNAVFHPKLWVLKFTSQSGPTLYRALVLTRNITPDRSWDSILVLDGELKDRTNAFAKNHPLADFLLELPKLAVSPPARDRLERLEEVADEVRRVEFVTPEPFENFEFLPIGVPGHTKNQFKGYHHKRTLIVSPFISPRTLKEIGRSKDDILISRSEELDALGADELDAFPQLFTLEEPVERGETSEEESSSEIDPSLSGLHAKLYVLEHGHDVTVVTGSANATIAAHERNVEFCVVLYGKRSKAGIDVLLGNSKNSGISNLLRPYQPLAEPVQPDEWRQEADKTLQRIRDELIAINLIAKVKAGVSPDTFDLEIHCAEQAFSKTSSVSVVICPVTLPLSHAISVELLTTKTPIGFRSLSIVDVSAFFTIELTFKHQTETLLHRFVIKLPLENPPLDRERAILRDVVSSPEKFSRYLSLLLATDAKNRLNYDLVKQAKQTPKGNSSSTYDHHLPLFEHLLRSFATNPKTLDPIQRLVEDLKREGDKQDLLPPGFKDVWNPIWEARIRSKATE